MVTYCLAQMGAWSGPSRAPNKHNPLGYFENDTLTRDAYQAIGVTEYGTGLGDEDPEIPQAAGRFREAVKDSIRDQGYKNGPWLYKEPATVLWWPLWHRAFPQARWLICQRDERGVIKSLRKFYDADERACRGFYLRFKAQLDAILTHPKTDCFQLSTDLMARGTHHYFEVACGWSGLGRRNALDIARANVRSRFWHHKENPC